MSFDLDPREVLQHLHELGYCNISPEQLKEFIKDLKKLMRYDAKKAALRLQRERELRYCQMGLQEFGDEFSMGEEQAVESRNQMQDRACPSRSSPRRPVETHQPASHCHEDCESMGGSEQDCGRVSSRNTGTTRKENVPSRPPSSFIRPASGRYKPKSDPVALYHYYQNIWSQNPQPGEDPRNQLRWSVRHQMMGASSQPKPVISRGSSIEKLKNRPEWQS